MAIDLFAFSCGDVMQVGRQPSIMDGCSQAGAGAGGSGGAGDVGEGEGEGDAAMREMQRYKDTKMQLRVGYIYLQSLPNSQ